MVGPRLFGWETGVGVGSSEFLRVGSHFRRRSVSWMLPISLLLYST